jgi:hypothetical protein
VSKIFEFERFRLSNHGYAECPECASDLDDGDEPHAQAEFDGKWVRAQDAIEREKANAAEIARLTAALQSQQYRSDVGDALGLCFFIVREPGLISMTYRPLPGDTVEKWLRAFYAEHPTAQVDVLRIWADSLGCSDIQDGQFYLAGFEAMRDMPEYPADDDD